MYSSQQLRFNDFRRGPRKGGGSRYREEEQIVDLTTQENGFCGCWLCRESRRSNNWSWPTIRGEIDEKGGIFA